ncbi:MULTISPECIES: polymer-forming cytoskeletal protein [Butyrivibrio]|uniref:Polymer-forming protein n=1 Tax=Butyrivibrio hungatei TaxID=185008 RepID=A0A1G5ADD9_9FIRM|nr:MULTISPECIES: polymer-forming cytoskeletal protein [Butyrivibrio]MEE3470359.1 polymer-forming cytoskeletal protein [Butyrivibrio hungatei]SCX75884.1 Polymer-forming protein [Butyrivibrio hungatei]
MGFFSELKSDLSQAVNTLMPDDKADETRVLDKESVDGETVRAQDVDLDSMLDRLDEIKLDDVVNEEESLSEESEQTLDNSENTGAETEEENFNVETSDKENLNEGASEEQTEEISEERALEQLIEAQTASEVKEGEPMSALEAINDSNIDEYIAESNATDKNTINGGEETMEFDQQTPTDETASITEGMILTGDLQTTGSLDLIGKINGNVKCLGKLNVTGEIVGDSDAAEIYAESARITGEVKSKGSVKVGQSTVIVGNIFGSSAVIAGAVKGDIDVHGPVVLDTTAIVMGNIKSQSVQINNGAVIEGMCSQAYADVNPSEFFEGLKNR